MATEIMTIPLMGINRNAAEGVAEQNPIDLLNLQPSRQGGWQTRASGFSTTPTDPDMDLRRREAVLGYDHRGYLSIVGTYGLTPTTLRYRILRPNGTIVEIDGPLASEGRVAHITRIGIYDRAMTNINGSGDFFVEGNSGDMHSGVGGFIPTVSTSLTGGTLKNGGYRIYLLSYIATPQGKLYTHAFMRYLDLLGTGDTGKITITGMPSSGATDRNTEIYLARNPMATSTQDPFTICWGAVTRPMEYVLQGEVNPGGTLELTEVQFGPTLNLYAAGFQVLASLGKFTGALKDYTPVAVYNGRAFFSPSTSSNSYTFGLQTPTVSPVVYSGSQFRQDLDRFNATTLGWTEIGSLNLFNPRINFYPLPAQNSTQITGFSQNTEGLVIWMDNESFLMRGDPSFALEPDFDYTSFNIRPFLPIGHDRGAPPGLLGVDTFIIWNGEVYRISGGNYENISKAVWDRDDPFVQVVGDVERACILLRTKSNICYAYHPQEQFWVRAVGGVTDLLTPTVDNVRIFAPSLRGFETFGRPENSVSTFSVIAVYRWVMADKHSRKMLSRIRLPKSQAGLFGTPSATVTIDGLPMAGSVTPILDADEWIFAFPLGYTGYQFEVRFSLPALSSKATIEGDIIVEYTRRNRKR